MFFTFSIFLEAFELLLRLFHLTFFANLLFYFHVLFTLLVVFLFLQYVANFRKSLVSLLAPVNSFDAFVFFRSVVICIPRQYRLPVFEEKARLLRFFSCSTRSVHFLRTVHFYQKHSVLNTSKASNMKYKTFPNQKVPLSTCFCTMRLLSFVRLRLLCVNFLKSSKGPVKTAKKGR